ncbi:MAG: sigma-70 family RNA polymerase sigma factor [Thiobacillus sp.]|nr:sigma-70 family RNA polymerase sigma factor [Thiobacillus sp.]
MSETDGRASTFEELMRLAQQGDRKAYGALFHAITPLLRSFVSNRVRNYPEAEDVVQEILLSIHRAGHTYDTGRPFKTWMFAIARYRLNDHLRRIYRNTGHSHISLEDLDNEIASPDVTERRDQSEYLDQMLSTLPKKQRKIVVMMKVEGHTAEETAIAMNMSVSAVKVAAHRAYKVLARKAKQEER